MLYLLKSGICLAILYGFYKLLLERENMHVFKRWYLLLSVLLAFIIPLITFTYTAPEILPEGGEVKEILLASDAEHATEQSQYITTILWGIYSLGVLVFGLLFIRNLAQMLFRIQQNIKVKHARITNVLVKKPVIPHTFFNYIFLNKHKFETQQIPKEVLLHEEAHARQKHSLDVVCIEALQVVFWFNPLIYMIKRAIKLNHEFLADRAVLCRGAAPSTYQHMLLAFSSNAKHHQLANAINYSLIKKRFTVMTKQTSKRAIGLRSLLLLPLLTLLLYGFSSKIAMPEENTVGTDIKEELQYADPMQHIVTDPEKEIVVEDVTIFVRSDGTLRVNNQSATLKNLRSKLDRMNKHLSFEERKRWVRAVIYADPSAKMKLVTAVKNIVREYGISKISLGTIPPPPPPVRDTDVSNEVEVEIPKAPEIIEIEETGEIIEIEEVPRPVRIQVVEVEPIVEEVEEVEVAPHVVEITELKRGRKKAVTIVEVPEVVEIPPPPPPVSPEEHVIKMAKKGAVFYYEGKKISSEKAIQLIKRNKHLNISSKGSNSKRPVVHISSKPIVIEN